MAFADFLFQGTPGQMATSSGQNMTSLPSYLEDYSYGILSNAAGLASQPYQPYQGARVAAPTDDQNAARAGLRSSIGGWQAPWTQARSDTLQAGRTTGLQPALGYLEQSAGVDSRATAAPDLAAARQTFPGAFQQYLNPYTSAVTDEIGRLGTRNWTENIMPGVNDQFMRAGQYGSSRNAEILGRAGRDVSADILGQQTGALERGYATAGNLFNQDAARSLSTASTASGIDENYARRLAETGVQTGALYDAERSGLLKTAASHLDQAKTNQDMSFKDYAALEGMGALEQSRDQAGLNLAYEDFQRQQQYPYDQVGFLANTARGVPYSSTQYTSSTAPSGYNPSLLAQLAGGAAGVAGLAKLFNRGGRVRASPLQMAQVDDRVARHLYRQQPAQRRIVSPGFLALTRAA